MTQPSTQLSDSTVSSQNIEWRARRRPSHELPLEGTSDEIREKLRADVEDRLRDVCSNWSTGEFDRVVTDVTETTLKFHGMK
jgi:hypothetical protein